MRMNFKTAFGLALGMFLVLTTTAPVQAQPMPGMAPTSRLLGLYPPVGLPIVPVFEGAYENADGSVTYSFGFLNRSNTEPVDIPLGVNNRVEPAQFNGVQPGFFPPGRHAGVFTVTVPASMRDGEVWWHIKTGEHEELKVPGRRGRLGYTLDKDPRPAGSVAPLVSFTEGGPQGQDPGGITADSPINVRAGTPVTLTIHAHDPSIRDMTDTRNVRGIPVRITWFKHQGPGAVTFERHPSSEPPLELTELQISRGATPPGPEQTRISSGSGNASVMATFSQPGEYVIRTMADNWSAMDSQQGDQCCWTNAYQRVIVTP
jgi:hypothetical protein